MSKQNKGSEIWIPPKMGEFNVKWTPSKLDIFIFRSLVVSTVVVLLLAVALMVMAVKGFPSLMWVSVGSILLSAVSGWLAFKWYKLDYC